MAAKTYPKEYFSSYDEYDTYFTCLSKAVPGDKVEVYVTGNGYRQSNKLTDKTDIVTVIGRDVTDGRDKFKMRILLGTKERFGSFWAIADDMIRPYLLKEDIKFASTFRYGYWAVYSDIRVARIIKA